MILRLKSPDLLFIAQNSNETILSAFETANRFYKIMAFTTRESKGGISQFNLFIPKCALRNRQSSKSRENKTTQI